MKVGYENRIARYQDVSPTGFLPLRKSLSLVETPDPEREHISGF